MSVEHCTGRFYDSILHQLDEDWVSEYGVVGGIWGHSESSRHGNLTHFSHWLHHLVCCPRNVSIMISLWQVWLGWKLININHCEITPEAGKCCCVEGKWLIFFKKESYTRCVGHVCNENERTWDGVKSVWVGVGEQEKCHTKVVIHHYHHTQSAPFSMYSI